MIPYVQAQLILYHFPLNKKKYWSYWCTPSLISSLMVEHLEFQSHDLQIFKINFSIFLFQSQFYKFVLRIFV